MTHVDQSTRAASSSTTRTRLLAGLAGVVGLIHLVLVPEYLEEKPYVGWLFLIGGLTLVATTVLGYRSAGSSRASLAWAAAAAVATGMFVGGIASRTTGLPGFHPHDWEISLVISLVLEAAYLLVWGSGARRELA